MKSTSGRGRPSWWVPCQRPIALPSWQSPVSPAGRSQVSGSSKTSTPSTVTGDRLRLAAAHGRYGPQVPRAQLRVMEGGAGNGGRLRSAGIGQRRAGRHAGVLTAGGQDPRQHAAGHGEQGETSDLREWRGVVALRRLPGSGWVLLSPPGRQYHDICGRNARRRCARRSCGHGVTPRRPTDVSSRPIGLSRGAKPRRLTIPFKTGCLVVAVRGEAPGVEALSTHGCKFSDDTQASGDT